MKSVHSVDVEQMEELESQLIKELQRDLVVKQLKSSLEEHCQAAVDQYTDYLKGEYVLVLTDHVQRRAEQLVAELLKGNDDAAVKFRLKARETNWGADKGKPFVYDPDGIRAAIWDRFKDDIAHAEMISLKEDNARLREALRNSREHRY